MDVFQSTLHSKKDCAADLKIPLLTDLPVCHKYCSAELTSKLTRLCCNFSACIPKILALTRIPHELAAFKPFQIGIFHQLDCTENKSFQSIDASQFPHIFSYYCARQSAEDLVFCWWSNLAWPSMQWYQCTYEMLFKHISNLQQRHEKEVLRRQYWYQWTKGFDALPIEVQATLHESCLTTHLLPSPPPPTRLHWVPPWAEGQGHNNDFGVQLMANTTQGWSRWRMPLPFPRRTGPRRCRQRSLCL